VKCRLPMMMVIIPLALCHTVAAQGRGGGAQAGGIHVGAGIPPGGNRGQFPILPVHIPGSNLPGFGPLALPRSTLLPFFPERPFFPDGRKGHGFGSAQSQMQYGGYPAVLPVPYAAPPAQDLSSGDQASNNWEAQPPFVAMPGPVAPGPSEHESSGLRTVQAPPSPPPVIRDEYPALLVLKNGSMHSVASYGITDNTLYFVTPQGESLHVSADLLERIYPAVKQK
jgi:hypothetical protein